MDDFIYDDAGKCVARIHGGDVLLDNQEGTKIGTVRDGQIYDLEGTLVGHLEGAQIASGNARMPAAFKKLLAG